MWCRSRYVLDLVIIDFLLKTVAANLSLLCARLKMRGISCCRCWSISGFQQVGVSVSFLSSPSSSLLSGTFRFVKPSMPIVLEPSPGTLTSSLCLRVCLVRVSTPLLPIFWKPTSPFTSSPTLEFLNCRCSKTASSPHSLPCLEIYSCLTLSAQPPWPSFSPYAAPSLGFPSEVLLTALVTPLKKAEELSRLQVKLGSKFCLLTLRTIILTLSCWAHFFFKCEINKT